MNWFKAFLRRRRLKKDLTAKLLALKKAHPEPEKEIELISLSLRHGSETSLAIAGMFLMSAECLAFYAKNEPAQKLEASSFEFCFQGGRVFVNKEGELAFTKLAKKKCENSLLPSEKDLGRRVWLLANIGLSYTAAKGRLKKKIRRAQALVEADKASWARVISSLMEVGPEQNAQAVCIGDEIVLIRNDGFRRDLSLAEGKILQRKQDQQKQRKAHLAVLLAKKEMFDNLDRQNLEEFRKQKDLLFSALELTKKQGRSNGKFELDRLEGIITYELVEEKCDSIPPEIRQILVQLTSQKILDLPDWVIKTLGLETSLEPNSSVAKQFDRDMLPPEMVETPTPSSTTDANRTPSQGLRKEIDKSFGV